jgi:hypothetical protein
MRQLIQEETSERTTTSRSIPRIVEPAQVHVHDELQIAQHCRPDPQFRLNVERLEPGIHGDPISVANHVGEIDRSAVRKDQFDLGVWNRETLDHVLDAARQEKRCPQRFVLTLCRKMMVQFGVEAEVGVCGWGVHVFMLLLVP